MTTVDLLTLFLGLRAIGPGALAPADYGVLERVELTRVYHGYGLDEVSGPGVVKLALEDCQYLGRQGWLVVDGVGCLPAKVVDCQSDGEEPLSALGILADVNWPELGHRQAWLVLWSNNETEKRPDQRLNQDQPDHPRLALPASRPLRIATQATTSIR